ncbi:hypothetical protein V6N11_004885 [Hibiscus sabdariffa]|uniref:Uncharacterized protein n=1 Tax=Hibiscus sabdariffa TaxID=183260 RepID=A0ABR2SIB8_9ROSI
MIVLKSAPPFGQRPRLRGDRSNRERLDDVFVPGLYWRAIPVRGREQDNKRAYLCSLLLHQARKFKDNCRKNEMHRGPSFCCGMLLRFTDSQGASGPT